MNKRQRKKDVRKNAQGEYGLYDMQEMSGAELVRIAIKIQAFVYKKRLPHREIAHHIEEAVRHYIVSKFIKGFFEENYANVHC